MLSRILEPEVMDTPEEALDYDAMDHGDVNRRFVSDLIVALRPAAESPSKVAGADDRQQSRSGSTEKGNSTILDLGAGTAQIPIELCRRLATVNVVAVDAAAAMLAVATTNVEQAALGDRIRLELADAKRLPYADGSFAAVISNSIVHHIAEPRSVLAEAVRTTAAGGLLFFRDLLRPDDRNSLDRLVETYAAGANEHQRRMFAESLHAALSLDEIQSLIAELGFARDTVKQTTDRHWTWASRVIS